MWGFMGTISDEYYKIGGESPDLDNPSVQINKNILFEILNSHSKLAQAEYNRNPGYNNTHFSHIAEYKMIAELEKIGILEEFLTS